MLRSQSGNPNLMKMKGNPSAMRPWADLPEPLAEAVLELLPLVDYIRFASVCKRWQSIRREHHPRHPMPHPLPWFVYHRLHGRDDNNNNEEEEEEGLLEFCSPLVKKNYRLPLPPGLRRIHDIYCLASCRGWLLMTSHKPHRRSSSDSNFILTEPLLFNPVTRTTIPLPPLPIIPTYVPRGALSSPPTNPECAILFMDCSGSVFLHRLRDGGGSGWMRVGHFLHDGVCSAIACGGKFYCQYFNAGIVGFIDPLLPQPTMQFLIGWQALHPPLCCLVDNDGDVCIVQALKLDVCSIKELRVFRADISSKEWVRVETLGDCAIFVNGPMFVNGQKFFDRCCAFSFKAVDAGLKKNTIYCSEYSWSNDGLCRWRAFDLDSGSWVDGTEVSYTYSKYGWLDRPWHNCWFMPTLDWVDTMQAGQ